MVYLGLTLGFLLGIWLYTNVRSKAKTIVPVEKKMFVCEYCHFAYLDEASKPVTQCPQCELFNKRHPT